MFALTYGRDVDWVRNLVASDGGTLKYKGNEIPIHRIRVVRYDDVKELFPSWIKLSLAIISLKDCVTADVDTG